jgi:histidinol-phosphate aminotransferase
VPKKENMKNNRQQPRAMKKLYALTEKKQIDLSLSENPLGCSPLVSSALKKIAVQMSDYPTPNGGLLKKKLATVFSLSEKNFFIANGSESIIASLPRVFGEIGGEVVVPTLTFPMFKICSELANKQIIAVEMTDKLGIDLQKTLQLVTPKTNLIFLCNPNNPTGSILAKKDILNFLEKIPKRALLVVDEANIEFGGESVVDEIKRNTNLVVLRTFSKGFGLATIRVGFAVANEEITQKLEEETPPFQISGMSEQLAMTALDDAAFIAKTKTFTFEQRQLLTSQLKKLGFFIFPSEANNLFVRLPKQFSAQEFENKLKEKEISLVSGSSFEGFDSSFFRVSVRDEKTNKVFLKKVAEIIGEMKVL